MLTTQEWGALTPEDQKAREAEMPAEIRAQKDKEEHDRLVNAAIEKDRKLKAAQQQVDDLNERIKALETAGAPNNQIKGLEQIREQYLADLEKDPLTANARLAAQAVQFHLKSLRESDRVRKEAVRKIRKEFPKDYEKYGDELEDILDKLENPANITVDSVIGMFNSLRGKTMDDQIKEAEQRGRQKALEEAGIVAVDEGGSSGGSAAKSSLSKEQQAEMSDMGLGSEDDYKEILRGLQEKDKLEGRSPRSLIRR